MKKVYYNDNTVGLVNLTSEGGIPYVAGTGIDITNDVISVTGMTAESAFTAYTSSTATEIGNKADTTAMTQAISEATNGKVDTSTYTAYTAATDTAIGNKADTTAVTADIAAAVSGKVDTTTYTAYTAATDSVLAGKQDALSAGTGIDITDNVISVTGGGGGGDCTVEETVVYDRIKLRYEDLNGDNKVAYIIVDYLSDKSSADNVPIYFIVGDTNNGQASYIYFDYVNHSANTTSLSDYVTAEYITDIQDFKVSLKSAYQSTWWFKNIQDLGYSKNVLIPFYTISSGNPCTVISTDVVGLVNKVKDITYKSIGNLQINSDKSKILVTYHTNDGSYNATYITLEDLDGTNGILKPNINIPLGTSGWTAIDIGDMHNCSTSKPGEIGATVYRITYSYDEQNIDYSNLTTSFEIHLKKLGSQWYNNFQYIDFVESGSTYVPSIRDQIFVGFEPTLEWDGTTKKLIVTYPSTYIYPNDPYNIGTYDVVVNSIGNPSCGMGSQDLLSGIEYYAEQIQPIKPFVQQLRTDVNTLSGQVATKQDVLSAGTGIEISGNVISATGGSITIDPSLDSGSTNAVANSAITNVLSNYYYARKVNNSVYSSPYGTISSNGCKGFTLEFANIANPNLDISSPLWLSKINGKDIFYTEYSAPNANYFNLNLVETSAITTSITSSSTDAQVPSAKAVYDIVGNIETLLSQI